MRVHGRPVKSLLVVLGLVVLPSYAIAQTLPATPPSGYYTAVAANPKGTVTNITYGSSYVARVYTPPGYSKGQAYPTMYLMHGLGGSEASWHDNDLYAHIQLDNLIAQKTVEPFILVFTRNDYNNYNFSSILLNDLLPYIEANYCVSTDPNNRALGGFSLGGMLTINIGFPNADKFHYLMPSSPAPGIQGQSQLFPNAGALAKANSKLAFFTCGSGEVGAYGCNNVDTVTGYVENVGLQSILKEFIVQGGAHNRNTWRPSFWNFAQLAHQAGFTKPETSRSAACTGGGMGGASGSTGGAAGTGGASGSTGGAAGTGGRGSGGSGTAGQSGSGGATTGGRNGSGGSTAGTGGMMVTGTGGMMVTGTGGAVVGTGGATTTGSGGAPAGTGGSTTIGSGGAPASTGGAPVSGTGGGAMPTGSGGHGPSVGGDDPGAGCGACTLVPSGSRGGASIFMTLVAVAAALVLRRGRRRQPTRRDE